MKRTITALLFASAAALSSAALATDSPFPEAAQEFPPIGAGETYMYRHLHDVTTQASIAGPSSASMFDAIQSDDTYMLRHLDSIEGQPSVPFPASVSD